MCLSPQIARIDINHIFKNKGKLLSNKSQKANLGKISISKKISSRNLAKILNINKNSHKRIINENTNILNLISSNNNYSNNNKINESVIFNMNSPQTTRYKMKEQSFNFFLNSNSNLTKKN